MSSEYIPSQIHAWLMGATEGLGSDIAVDLEAAVQELNLIDAHFLNLYRSGYTLKEAGKAANIRVRYDTHMTDILKRITATMNQ